MPAHHLLEKSRLELRVLREDNVVVDRRVIPIGDEFAIVGDGLQWIAVVSMIVSRIVQI
jgi:hypothetical protein